MKARRHFSKSRVILPLAVLAAAFLALTASGALSGKEIPGLKEARAAFTAGNFSDARERFLALESLSYDFPRFPCKKGAADRHLIYAGQRRRLDR